jgi:toxin ParE1/3/4
VTRLTWSPRSIRDLESIREYIARDSPLYADLVVQRLVQAPERLQQFPESGRIVPERDEPHLRELIVRKR